MLLIFHLSILPGILGRLVTSFIDDLQIENLGGLIVEDDFGLHKVGLVIPVDHFVQELLWLLSQFCFD